MRAVEDLYYRYGSSIFMIEKAVVAKLLSYRQVDEASFEAAGVLVGERRGEHLVIKSISEPSVLDSRSRFAVNRSCLSHQEHVSSEHLRSDGTRQYLGEWHTHPEDYPVPSWRDKLSWSVNLKSTKPMLVIIVGRREFWVARKFRFSLSRLVRE